jgi:hypothetical protein
MLRWSDHFCQLLNAHGFHDVRQTEIRTAEPLVPEPSAFEIDMAIEEIELHKSSTDKIPAELTKSGDRPIQSKSRLNKKELPKEWKESIIVPIYKKDDKTNCSNNRGISSFRTTYKILSYILLSRLTPFTEENTGDHQCGFRSNSSTTVHIFHIRPILEKKWKQ